MKRLAAILTVFCLLVGIVPVNGTTYTLSSTEETTVRERKGLSYTYPQTYNQWMNGLFGGNGVMGITVFGNPLNDTIIYNHRLFNMAATRDRSFKTMSQEVLKQIRDACLAEDWNTANDLANTTNWQDGGEGSRHPGYLMKIQIPENGEVTGYSRSNDYTTGEILVNWTDNRGQWERKTFVSRKDNVIVQYLPAPSGGKLNCTVQLGTDPGMHFPGDMTFINNSDAQYLNMRVIYPNPGATGNAGYEGVTRVVAQGGTVQYVDGKLQVTGADSLMLLTRIEKYYQNCQTEWNKKQMQADLAALPTDYNALLEGQRETHTEIYNRVTLDLNAPAEDRAKSNEQLLAEQRVSAVPNLALYERMFDAGRYHYLCSSGEMGPPDLLGIWTGDCNVGWSGYYHLDANLNLQISGAVLGNMLETMEGYFNAMDGWSEGFRINAEKLLGCRGLLAAGNTPLPTPVRVSGLISDIRNRYYPYQYVTGEMSWLLQPYWEYYQVTGDTAFLRDRLYPLLREVGIFYEDFLQEKDANGKYIFAGSISPENQPAGLGNSLVNNSAFDIAGAQFGLTILLETCRILNVEQGAGEGVERWSEILENLPPYIINDDGALAEWAWPSLANRNSYTHRHSSGLIGVWPYRDITADDTPALYEAAKVFLAKKDTGNYENAGHGLLHGALIAAALHNEVSLGKKLLRLAKDRFYYDGMTTSHYPNPGSGDYGVFCTDVANTVPTIMMEMLLGSDDGRIELLPALPAELSSGTITGLRARNQITVEEITWDTEKGTIHCVLTSAVDQTIELIQRKGMQSITTTAPLAESPLGGIARKVTLQKDEPTVIEIRMVKPAVYINLSAGKTATASSMETGRLPEYVVDQDPTTRWASLSSDNNWIQIDLGSVEQIDKIVLDWEAAYAKRYTISVSDDGEQWQVVYTNDDGKGSVEEILLDAKGRYVRMTGLERVPVNGVKYGYSLYEFTIYQLEREDQPEILYGDVDGNGKVNTTDARLALQYSVQKVQLDSQQQLAADVDGKAGVTTTDARLILQKSVGKIEIFPIEQQQDD